MWRVKHRAPTEPRSWLIAGLYKHSGPSGTKAIRQQHYYPHSTALRNLSGSLRLCGKIAV